MCYLISNQRKVKGMKKGFQIIRGKFMVSKEKKEIFEEFVCQLYGSKHHNVCYLGYHLLVSKKERIEKKLLCPSKVNLNEHTIRYNYEIFVRKN